MRVFLLFLTRPPLTDHKKSKHLKQYPQNLIPITPQDRLL